MFRARKNERIEDSIVKYIRNIFKLKKYIEERNDTAIIDKRNLFRFKKVNEAIKDRTIRDVRNFSEHEEEDYY